MKLEFVAQSMRDGSHPAANAARLVNMYREPAGGRTGYVLRSVPGVAVHSEMTGAAVRAVDQVGDSLYAACGGRLWQIDTAGTASNLGAITDDEETTISSNNGNITVACGGKYYRWNGTTINEPTPGAFTSIGSVGYIANYTVLSELDGRRFKWSDPGDSDTLPGLNFSSADAFDDNILRLMGIGGNLWVFKERSTEIWYLTGQAGAAAFDRVAGQVGESGLRAYRLLSRVPNGAFWIGSDGRAHTTSGPVSIPAVEVSIAQDSPEACLYYEDRGHGFAVITFRDRPAWCFDLSTGEWHERAEDVGLDPWSVTCAAKLGNRWYAGRNGGDIVRFARTNRDVDTPLKRVAVSRTAENDGQRFRLAELEVFGRVGDADAAIMLRLSGDAGRTWGAERTRAFSAAGDYAGRCIWRALGQFRSLTAEISMTDDADVTLDADGRVVLG